MANRFGKSGAVIFIMGVMLLGTVTCCFADSQSDYDAELSSRGFPPIVIQSMTPDGKEALCSNDSLKFAGAAISTMEEHSGKGFHITVDQNGKLGSNAYILYSALVSIPNQLGQDFKFIPILSRAVVSKGMISSGDLVLNIITTSSQSKDHLEYLNVQENYIWRNPPLWRLSDKVEFSWDSDRFAIDGDSIATNDQYSRKALNGTIHLSNPVVESRFADLSRTGGATYSDLPGHQTFAQQIWGDISFNLHPSSDMPSDLPSGSAKICVSYTHKSNDLRKVWLILQYLIEIKPDTSLSFIEEANRNVTCCAEAKW